MIEDGVCVRSGVIDLSKNHDAPNRMKHMMYFICQLVESTKVEHVVFEDVQQQSNSATYKMLSQIQGAIMYCCYENEIKFSIIAPTAWRSLLGFTQGRKIRRSALKIQAINYVNEHCNKKVSSDEADAICIGLAYYKQTQNDECEGK